jgi:hypothetical protein
LLAFGHRFGICKGQILDLGLSQIVLQLSIDNITFVTITPWLFHLKSLN